MSSKQVLVRAAAAVASLAAALALPALAHASTIVIDDFHTDQSSMLGSAVYPPETGTGSLVVPPAEAGSGIIGGERDVAEYGVQRYTDEVGQAYRPNDAQFAWSQGGEFIAERQIGVKGSFLIAWDGQDGGASAVDYTGLGGVNLRTGGIDRFRFDMDGVGGGLQVTVYTDATHYSTATVSVPFLNRATVDEPFAAFATGAGAAGPADFSNVGAITAGQTDVGDLTQLHLFGITAVSPPDSTPPTITASAKTADGQPYTGGTWTRQNVIVSFQCSDAGSGVATVTPPVTVSQSGHDMAVTGTCVDNSGNRASATFYGIDIDNTGPSLVPTITAGGARYDQGTWTNKDVTVSWSCSDALNAVASAPAPTTVTTEGAGQQVSATCTDVLGNSTSRTVGGIDIDKTAPEADAWAYDLSSGNDYEPGTWTSGDVDVYFYCADDLSGVASTPDDVFVTKSGAGQTASGTCTDQAGNAATATFTDIDVDKTPPVLTARATSAGAAYTAGTWTNADVVVAFACTDADSGVASAPAPVTVSGEGSGQTASASCTDLVGNTATVSFGPIDIDRTAPTVTASATTADGALYTAGTWTAQAVTVTFACSDGASGVAAVSAAQTLDSDEKDASVTGTCTDAAGNGATAAFDHIDIDRTPPTIVATATPAPNASGWNDGPVTVTFTCNDGDGSGVATCPDPVTLSSEGAAQSVTGTATDAVGHSASATAGGISIDTTPPVVVWGDHPATYLPTDRVAIACTASDALSGIAASTCADIDAPASSFGVGTTTLTATVTDAAGNTTTTRTSFTVTVTFADLCTLTKQYVSSKVAATVACAPLLAAEKASKRARPTLVRVYVAAIEVDQKLKLISPQHADELITLARSLA
ncbi:MAG: HYR domain-containing protein [Rhodospirillales bacterium]|nr:HYR domain-containing protein [Rhodospirillales bacterium]